MLKKVQKILHRRFCVLAYFSVTVSDHLQSLITSDNFVITSNRAAERFERSAGMRKFVENARDVAFSG
jgi:hypothetical protein